MGKEHTFILMEINSQENGKSGKNMGKAHLHGPMEISMKENGRMG